MINGDNKQHFRQLMHYLKPYKLLVAAIILLVIVTIVLELGVAWMIKELTDQGTRGNLSAVIQYFAIGLGLFFLTGLNNFGKSLLTGKIAEKTVRLIKESTYVHLQKLPVTVFETGRSGNLLSHFSNDINMILQALKFYFIPLVENPLMALSAFGFLFAMHWQLALICTATGPLTLFVGKYFAGPIGQVSKHVQGRIGESNAFLNDSIQGMQVVKSFGLEEEFAKKFEGYCSEIYQGSIKRTYLESLLGGVGFFVGSLSFMLTFGFGIIFVLRNELTVGELWAFVQLVNRVIWPFSGLARIWGGFVSSLSAGGRIFTLMEHPVEQAGNSAGSSRFIREGRIQFDDVVFAYNPDNPVLRKINFTTEPGQVVAFVGPSGAGKSTIFKLLLGFYSPVEGQVSIDGVGIAELGVDELRRKCSFVSQDVYLFHGTVAENIRYGKLNATQAEIEQAAREANIHQFIQGLPQGYQTLVGERGINLSGGEKQRLSIARALLKDAPILLLDEPTSSLDSESEKLVKDALERLMTGKTTLVIAHRLSTIIAAEQIIVLDEGQIEASGTHVELLDKSPTYKKLYQIQFSESEAC